MKQQKLKTNKTILDVCCGSKMFWFDKNNENTKICCMNDATHDILHDRMCSDIIFDKIEAFIHYVEKEKMPKN